jgi:hypothetical protein
MESPDASLIAPCGINCGVCMAYLLRKIKCPGCRGGNENKSKSCVNCRIKNCEFLKNNQAEFCYECDKYPCEKIKHLDKRYRAKYHMSMIDNLENIKKMGLDKFIEIERNRRTCLKCGGTICVHKGYCINCGKKIY